MYIKKIMFQGYETDLVVPEPGDGIYEETWQALVEIVYETLEHQLKTGKWNPRRKDGTRRYPDRDEHGNPLSTTESPTQGSLFN